MRWLCINKEADMKRLVRFDWAVKTVKEQG